MYMYIHIRIYIYMYTYIYTCFFCYISFFIYKSIRIYRDSLRERLYVYKTCSPLQMATYIYIYVFMCMYSLYRSRSLYIYTHYDLKASYIYTQTHALSNIRALSHSLPLYFYIMYVCIYIYISGVIYTIYDVFMHMYTHRQYTYIYICTHTINSCTPKIPNIPQHAPSDATSGHDKEFDWRNALGRKRRLYWLGPYVVKFVVWRGAMRDCQNEI